MNNILFIVDPQYDFIEEGNLPVKGSFDKMCALSAYLSKLDFDYYDKIFVSLDWHPYTHCSFKQNGGEWPTHCVEQTHGAQIFQPVLFNLLYWMQRDKVVFVNKGCNKTEEEYSAVIPKNFAVFWDDFKNATQIDVCGIVGTVCVKNTIAGIKDFIKALDNKPTINVLLDYTAQFSDEDENDFKNWCIENNVTLD